MARMALAGSSISASDHPISTQSSALAASELSSCPASTCEPPKTITRHPEVSNHSTPPFALPNPNLIATPRPNPYPTFSDASQVGTGATEDDIDQYFFTRLQEDIERIRHGQPSWGFITIVRCMLREKRQYIDEITTRLGIPSLYDGLPEVLEPDVMRDPPDPQSFDSAIMGIMSFADLEMDSMGGDNGEDMSGRSGGTGSKEEVIDLGNMDNDAVDAGSSVKGSAVKGDPAPKSNFTEDPLSAQLLDQVDMHIENVKAGREGYSLERLTKLRETLVRYKPQITRRYKSLGRPYPYLDLPSILDASKSMPDDCSGGSTMIRTEQSTEEASAARKKAEGADKATEGTTMETGERSNAQAAQVVVTTEGEEDAQQPSSKDLNKACAMPLNQVHPPTFATNGRSAATDSPDSSTRPPVHASPTAPFAQQVRSSIRTTPGSASSIMIAAAATTRAPRWEEDSVYVKDTHALTTGLWLAAMSEGSPYMAKPNALGRYPTEKTLHKFFELLLSSASNDDGPDVPLYYNPARKPLVAIKRVVLSLTATEKVYEEITPDTAVFLHRPWNLVRKRLGPMTSVFASHKGFDELYTTGHNLALMRVCGASANYVPIFGYKSSLERKMGVVSKIPLQSMPKWIEFIKRTFGLQYKPEDSIDHGHPVPRVLACMNGFDPDLIDRAIAAAASLFPSWPSSQACLPTEILYLTGESRPLGAEYAAIRGVPVVFTGHRNAELWGLYLLARRLKEGYPDLDVSIVDEAEEEKRMEDEKRAVDKAQARNRKAATKAAEKEK